MRLLSRRTSRTRLPRTASRGGSNERGTKGLWSRTPSRTSPVIRSCKAST